MEINRARWNEQLITRGDTMQLLETIRQTTLPVGTLPVGGTLPVWESPPPVWETWEGLLSQRVKNLKLARGVSRPGVSRPGVSRVITRGTRLVPAKYNLVPSMSLIHAMRAVTNSASTNSLRPDGRGIDLAKRGDEVRKLFYAAFARGLVKDGFDPEEALQEVYRGLLSRNLGSCPFDVKKSSFGHYVHIVTRCVLANYVRKEKKRTHHEVSGESSYGDDNSSREWEIPVPATQEDSRRGMEYLREQVSQVVSPCDLNTVLRALSIMAEGHTRREAASQAGVDPRVLAVALEALKAARCS